MPIEFVATSRLPTAFGEFNITVFQDPKTGEEHVALSKGLDQPITEPVLVRVHSECLTGDAFAPRMPTNEKLATLNEQQFQQEMDAWVIEAQSSKYIDF